MINRSDNTCWLAVAANSFVLQFACLNNCINLEWKLAQLQWYFWKCQFYGVFLMLMSNQPVIKCWSCLKQKILLTLKFNVTLVQSSFISWEAQCWIWTMVIILSIYWKRMTIFKFRPNSGVAQIFHKQLQTISGEFHGSGRLEDRGKCVLKDLYPCSNCNPWHGKKRKVGILSSCAQSDSSGKILNL